MDETLLKASINPKKPPEKFDSIVKMKSFDRPDANIYVKIRPYLKEVLRQLKHHFEMILYTSGS